jgi:hypothetical protein
MTWLISTTRMGQAERAFNIASVSNPNCQKEYHRVAGYLARYGLPTALATAETTVSLVVNYRMSAVLTEGVIWENRLGSQTRW